MRRTMLYRFCVGAGLLILGSPTAWANSPPQVTNVTAAQRTDGSNLVDIGYDLGDADADPCTVWVEASDDGGATWDVPAVSFTGDVGADIIPGAGKGIVWGAGTELPEVYGTDYVVRVYADDGYAAPPGMVPIPGGEFLMGDHHDGYPEWLPVHAVYVGSFYMDVYAVTNQQYADALTWAYQQGLIQNPESSGPYVRDSTTGTYYCSTRLTSSWSQITWDGSTFGVVGEELPPDDLGNKTNHPMTVVFWYGAAAYSNWRSAQDGLEPCYNLTTWECDFQANGYRLPTEAEWEYAARGGEHDPYYPYPWGDTIDGSMANYDGSGDPYEGTYPGAAETTPVGYYDGNQSPPGVDMANGYGLYDMAGNVFEFCHDWYSGTYYSSSPYDNPHGPASGPGRVCRGGAWGWTEIAQRCAYRHYFGTNGTSASLGFRLALQGVLVCGDGSVDPGEECDGIDDTACPGACLNDCTCGPFCDDGACDPGENSCNCPEDCGTPPDGETPGSTCTDRLDNDCDGFADCDDPDCERDPRCDGVIVPTVSEWGLIVLILLMLSGLSIVFTKRKTHTA